MTNIDEEKVKEFCSSLKTLRTSVGWTQEDLANRVGVSRQTINSIESGKTIPSTALFWALAGLFFAGANFIPIVNGVVNAIGLPKIFKNLWFKNEGKGD